MNSNERRRRVIYILSPSFSGSTLLTLLLAENDRIATIGELKATSMGLLDTYKCSCGQLIRDCEFWGALQSHLQKIGTALHLEDFGTHFRSESWFSDILLRTGPRGSVLEALRDLALRCWRPANRELTSRLNRNSEVIDAICDIQHKEIFLDSSKDPIRLKHFLRSGQWDIKVVNLIRDGRGVVDSYMRHYGMTVRAAVKEWLTAMKEIKMVLEMTPSESKIILKYEDICASPRQSLDGLMTFLGERGPRSWTLNRSSSHIIGNSMRLSCTKYIRLDEKWRRSLCGAELQFFQIHAGKMNRRIGYKT